MGHNFASSSFPNADHQVTSHVPQNLLQLQFREQQEVGKVCSILWTLSLVHQFKSKIFIVKCWTQHSNKQWSFWNAFMNVWVYSHCIVIASFGFCSTGSVFIARGKDDSMSKSSKMDHAGLFVLQGQVITFMNIRQFIHVPPSQTASG